MNHVEIVNLAGRAYNIDSDGVVALQAWLQQAAHNLEGDPDRDELLVDFEQVIGEKLAHGLGPHRDVASADEVAAVLASIGPVVAAGSSDAAQTDTTAADASARVDPASSTAPRKLYRIEQGQLVAGVSTGIAAYLHVDVNVVRAAWILFALLSGGAALIAYVVMVILVPVADTADERAAAHGRLATAQDLIDRTRSAAEPALAKLGRVLGKAARVCAALVLIAALAGIALVIACWLLFAGSVIGGADWVMEAFDPDVDTWIVALWTTCAAWVALAPLVALAGGMRALLARGSQRRSKGLRVGVAVGAAAVWLIAIVASFALPYSHSAQLRDVLHDGQGRIHLLNGVVCFESDDQPPSARERCKSGDERVEVED